MEDISVSNFNLKVLHCGEFDGYAYGNHFKTNIRTVCDYEVEYFIKSDGGIEVDGKYIPFESGSINFRKPRQVVRGIGAYKCYGLCIDISGKRPNPSEGLGFPEAGRNKIIYLNSVLESLPSKICTKNHVYLSELFRSIYQNFMLHDTLLIKSDLYKLMSELCKIAHSNDIRFIHYNTSIKKSVCFINNHLTCDIDVGRLAECAGLSTSYFHKIFKDSMGMTPIRFILRLRLKKAKNLLSLTDMDIARVGSECGFFDSAYFCFIFKREEKMTPGEYRKLSAI